VTVKALDREIAINLKTAVLVSQAAIEALNRTQGCIINFASISYFNPQAPMAVYSAAKAAVAGFTRSLALELRDRKVRVNAIAPAMVRTVDNVAAVGDGEAQYVEMQEITDGVLTLASPGATATGQILPISPAGAGPI
jgi:NAD(P)-dependent dehydrogenase (short-subunit alcohol dehydrogenase family)